MFDREKRFINPQQGKDTLRVRFYSLWPSDTSDTVIPISVTSPQDIWEKCNKILFFSIQFPSPKNVPQNSYIASQTVDLILKASLAAFPASSVRRARYSSGISSISPPVSWDILPQHLCSRIDKKSMCQGFNLSKFQRYVASRFWELLVRQPLPNQRRIKVCSENTLILYKWFHRSSADEWRGMSDNGGFKSDSSPITKGKEGGQTGL